MDVSNAVVEFKPNEVGTYGVEMLKVILTHEAARDKAEAGLREADEREKLISFELTRTVLYLHEQDKIDLYTIYQNNNAETAKLYRTILVETGVLKRTVSDDDTITYNYTDETLDGFYNFTEELKEQDETEYKKRRSRRNDLNIRLSRVCKAAIALHDSQTSSSDMVITKEEDGEFAAVLKKGPKELMGSQDSVQIFSKSVSAVEGASVTPTITGLGKLADNTHKTVATKNEVENSKDSAPTAAKDFLALMNTALITVKGKEGNFSTQEKTVLKNLLTEIKKYVN